MVTNVGILALSILALYMQRTRSGACNPRQIPLHTFAWCNQGSMTCMQSLLWREACSCRQTPLFAMQYRCSKLGLNDTHLRCSLFHLWYSQSSHTIIECGVLKGPPCFRKWTLCTIISLNAISKLQPQTQTCSQYDMLCCSASMETQITYSMLSSDRLVGRATHCYAFRRPCLQGL